MEDVVQADAAASIAGAEFAAAVPGAGKDVAAGFHAGAGLADDILGLLFLGGVCRVERADAGLAAVGVCGAVLLHLVPFVL